MKIRYRPQVIGGIFNKKIVLVLQVHKHLPEGKNDHNGMHTWVDASVEDIQEILKEQS